MTGHYLTIAPAAVVIEPFVLRKSQRMDILELSNNLMFATMTLFRRICS